MFVRDMQTGVATRISVASNGAQGNNNSSFPSISADGRYIAFVSSANNLVVGDTNGLVDVFLHDMWTGITTRVSVNSNGIQGDSHSEYLDLSSDGRYVAFTSGASNLVSDDTNGVSDVFVHDVQTGITNRQGRSPYRRGAVDPRAGA